MPNPIIGTSGWSYAHWVGNFYPESAKATQWLEIYSQSLSTVEINSTFYHTSSESTVKKWYDQVPKNFLFSIKANRYITHLKRLKECEDSMKLFHESVIGFKEKMGPILFQLPPSFIADHKRLEKFMKLLNKNHSYVFEFRHESWFTSETYKLLSKKNIALCISDLAGTLTPEKITADFTYLRLHGPKKAYAGSYGQAKLKVWKTKIDKWINDHKQVYCYFDNDEKGYALKDAIYLSNTFCNKR